MIALLVLLGVGLVAEGLEPLPELPVESDAESQVLPRAPENPPRRSEPSLGDVMSGSLRLVGAFLHFDDIPELYPSGDDGLFSTVARVLVDRRFSTVAFRSSSTISPSSAAVPCWERARAGPLEPRARSGASIAARCWRGRCGKTARSVAALGGRVAERWVVGGSFQGSIRALGLHGEGHNDGSGLTGISLAYSVADF